ncbi:Fic family protein [Halomonas salifodinae]|uniref:Fic family protein n=1 Tax=Halomonas salifodinae TaxID=438745 RepID=UPI0033A594E7
MNVEEILVLDRFRPEGAAKYVIDNLDDTVRTIDSHRPLPHDLVERMQQEILADRVHSSAVTEGNRLSRRETLVVLSTGLIDAGSRKDVVEVRNLARAILETEEAIQRNDDISPLLLRHLQGILLDGIERVGVGEYRKENVAISGANQQPPDFNDVPILVSAICDVLNISNGQYHPVQIAAWAHWAMARVHPFRDGNGRLARIVQDMVLMKHRYVPAPLRSEDREGPYYEALDRADSGDGQALLEIVAKNTLRMADRYVSLIEDQESKQDWLAAITNAATEKVRQTDHRRFLAVQRSLANLKAEFHEICKELDRRIPDLHVRFADYGDVEFEKFKQIEQGRFAKKSWLWGVEFRMEETTLRFVFWYGAHLRDRQVDTHADMPCPLVLIVSLQQGNYYRRLDEVDEDRISVRTVMPAGTDYWRKRYDPVEKTDVWDEDLSAGEIARGFFQEALGKLGLV